MAQVVIAHVVYAVLLGSYKLLELTFIFIYADLYPKARLCSEEILSLVKDTPKYPVQRLPGGLLSMSAIISLQGFHLNSTLQQAYTPQSNEDKHKCHRQVRSLHSPFLPQMSTDESLPILHSKIEHQALTRFIAAIIQEVEDLHTILLPRQLEKFFIC